MTRPDDLPPLPMPAIGFPWRMNANDGSVHSSGFTADQMREYALAAEQLALRRVAAKADAIQADPASVLRLQSEASTPSEPATAVARVGELEALLSDIRSGLVDIGGHEPDAERIAELYIGAIDEALSGTQAKRNASHGDAE